MGAMDGRIRWGILGTGNIARQFAVGVAASRRGVLAAVGSRRRATAEGFATNFCVERVADTYDDLVGSSDVDAVYVSLPNHLHREWTVKALRAGKHVLCEKPFAVDAAESAEMFDAARRAGRLVMEAFMYRSHPQTLAVVAAVRAGEIGQLRLIRTSFCYRTTRVAENIRFKPEMAGGGLMDVGCYCISFSRLFAGLSGGAGGEPDEVHVAGHVHESGVDDLASGVMRFPGGVVASFTCGMTVQAENTAYLCGTEGYIEVPVPWKPPKDGGEFTIARQTPPKMDGGLPPGVKPRETRKVVSGGVDLYAYEADDFAAAVLDGTPLPVSEADTMGNMRVLDEMRARVQGSGFRVQ
jgi:predicted dehydrogenase